MTVGDRTGLRHEQGTGLHLAGSRWWRSLRNTCSSRPPRPIAVPPVASIIWAALSLIILHHTFSGLRVTFIEHALVVRQNLETDAHAGHGRFQRGRPGRYPAVNILFGFVAAASNRDGVVLARQAIAASIAAARRNIQDLGGSAVLSLLRALLNGGTNRLGASPCGSSSVTTTISAYCAAIAPIIGRLSWSRSPVAPKTIMTLPSPGRSIASRARVSPSGLWAKSTIACGAKEISCIRPGTTGVRSRTGRQLGQQTLTLSGSQCPGTP